MGKKAAAYHIPEGLNGGAVCHRIPLYDVSCSALAAALRSNRTLPKMTIPKAKPTSPI